MSHRSGHTAGQAVTHGFAALGVDQGAGAFVLLVTKSGRVWQHHDWLSWETRAATPALRRLGAALPGMETGYAGMTVARAAQIQPFGYIQDLVTGKKEEVEQQAPAAVEGS